MNEVCTDGIVDAKDINLPEELLDIAHAAELPSMRHRWNTNEEIASYLLTFHKHKEWLKNQLVVRPVSGSILMYSRKLVRYRQDGFCWKRRNNTKKTIREDHMKLKVRGVECIYGSYVHSSILSTFHRRSYWLLQNPDIVFVHYLNVPCLDTSRLTIPSLSYGCSDDDERWTKESLVEELRPIFHTSSTDPQAKANTEDLVQSIAAHLIAQQDYRKPHSDLYIRNCCSKQQNTDLMVVSCLRDEDKDGKNDILWPTMLTQVDINSAASGTLLSSKPALNAPEFSGDCTPVTVISHNSDNLRDNSLMNFLDDPSSQQSILCNSSNLSLDDLQNLAFEDVEKLCPDVSSALIDDKYSRRSISDYITQPDSIQFGNYGIVNSESADGNINNNLHNMNSTDLSSFNYETMAEIDPATMERSSADEPERCNISIDFNKTCLTPLKDTENKIHNSFSGYLRDTSPLHYRQSPSDVIGQPELSNDVNLPQNDPRHSNLLSSPTSTTSHLMQGRDNPSVPVYFHIYNDQKLEGNSQHPHLDKDRRQPLNNSTNHTMRISDFSPDWSTLQGGVKVLITGPWSNAYSKYECLFNEISVSATLVQLGVLRCYTPEHAPGSVSLRVKCDGQLLSEPVMFHFRYSESMSNYPTDFDWFLIEDNQLMVMMIERFVQIEKRLSSGSNHIASLLNLEENKTINEETFLQIVKLLSPRLWLGNVEPLRPGLGHMTLVHISSALGYNQLIRLLFEWKKSSPSSVLDLEVDASSKDNYNCTPLMWACARGLLETVRYLYQSYPPSLYIANKDGLLPAVVARRRSHTQISAFLEYADQALPVTGLLSHDKTVAPLRNLMGDMRHSAPRVSDPWHSNVSLRPTSNHSNDKLSKCLSIDIFPRDRHIENICVSSTRGTSSEPDLSSYNIHCFNSAHKRYPHLDKSPLPSMDYNLGSVAGNTHQDLVHMDTDESADEDGHSNLFPNLCNDSSDVLSVTDAVNSVSEKHMVTLANKIIAAMPERIKLSPCACTDDSYHESSFNRARSESYSSVTSQFSPHTSSYDDDSGISTPMYDNLIHDDPRYVDNMESTTENLTGFIFDSTPPTTADFNAYFNAPATYMEKDFSQLTLSDQEQRKLYEAARVIQSVYPVYRDRQQQEQKEIEAAILIQTYYRRYKQYMYHKKCQAAVVIQSQFRSYFAQKCYRRSRDAAVVIQTQYRSYREHERRKRHRHNAAAIIQQRYRKHYQRKSKTNIASTLLQLASDTNETNILQDYQSTTGV